MFNKIYDYLTGGGGITFLFIGAWVNLEMWKSILAIMSGLVLVAIHIVRFKKEEKRKDEEEKRKIIRDQRELEELNARINYYNKNNQDDIFGNF